MQLREWLNWLRELPWCLRWFVILVLIRPLLDTLYFLKDVSPLLSPLNIVGLLTPLAIILSYSARNFPRAARTGSDVLLGLWATLTLVNVVVLFFEAPSFDGFGSGLKLALAPLLYFFSRHLIRSKRDLAGLLTTFLYSTFVPIGMLLWERIVGPLGALVQTRGAVRYEGLYADVLSYATFIMGAWIVASFFVLDGSVSLFRRGRIWKLPLMGTIWLLCLSSMHHATSWVAAGALMLLFIVHQRNARDAITLLALAGVGAVALLMTGSQLTRRVTSMFDTDILILRGEKDSRQAFHGRMQRWTRHVEEWKQLSPMAKGLGVVMDGAEQRVGRIGTGIHNDFLRILFSTGIIGLAAYLLFLLHLLFRTLLIPRSERYLVWSVVALVLLYSITTLPTMYSGLMYLCLPVLAFGARSSRQWAGQVRVRVAPQRSPGGSVIMAQPR